MQHPLIFPTLSQSSLSYIIFKMLDEFQQFNFMIY